MPLPPVRPFALSALCRLWSLVAPLLACGMMAACGSTSGSALDSGKGGADTGGSPPLAFDAGGKKDSGATKVIVSDSGTMKDGSATDAVTHETSAPVDAGASGNDATLFPTDAQANTFPAFLPNAPQVVNAGGLVLHAPVFVPVIFSGNPYASQIPTFLAAVGASNYWKSAVSEYGVGPATTAPPIVLDETFPSSITDDQLQVWLANRIGLDPRFGALGQSLFDAGPFDAGSVDATAPLSDAASPSATPPAGAIYVLFIPSGTSVSLDGSLSCSSFGGYHNSFDYAPNGQSVVYATIPTCGTFGNLMGFDAVTGPTSHELAEASTDPYVGGATPEPAYVTVDTNHFYWQNVLGGGEVGDMCAQFPQAFFAPSEASLSAYQVQRIWSNKAASAGQDPCQPALSAAAEPYYFNAVPEQTSVAATFAGQNVMTLGISLAVGAETTLTFDLFSTASTGGQPWQVEVEDLSALRGSTPQLTFTPDMVMGDNGYKLSVTIKNVATITRKTHPFLLASRQGLLENWWIGVVVND